MAVTRLSDSFVYPVYMSYIALDNPEKTNFWQSGVVANNDLLNSLARGPGKEVEVPFWNDLDPGIEPDYTNDDPTDLAVPDKITSGNMKARKAFMHKAWSDMDLVAELTGSDPMQHIKNRFGIYWMRQWQRRLIATLQGVIADNIANDGGDMGIDISATGDGLFSSEGVVLANGTLGDAAGGMRAIAVHSKVRDRMILNEEIVYLPDSEGNLTIPTYKDMRVVVDDSMPKTGSGANTVYTSIMMGTGAFGFGGVEGSAIGFGEGIPQVPAYTDRIELAGNGGGQEIIGERKTWMLHPFGFTWIDAGGGALVEFSPTLANLATAAKWDRVVNRKNVPLAWLRSKA